MKISVNHTLIIHVIMSITMPLLHGLRSRLTLRDTDLRMKGIFVILPR